MNQITGRSRENENDVDTILLNDLKVIDKTMISNNFNEFYAEIASDIHGKIPSAKRDYITNIPINTRTIFVNPVTVHDIISITNSLRNTNKLYDVPAKFLKLIINVITDIITDLFNECILEGHFPTELMTSRLMPLYKQGSKLQMENYRPISLLSTLSKIFEKVLSTQYLSFIDKHNLLSNNQFGFRKNLNTTDAALKLVNDMVPVFQNKRYGACLFVDFRKAFDTLDRDILLRKLFIMGVRGIGDEILNSYYKGDRKQYVHVNGVSSDLLDSKNGCIQGSN